MKDSAPCFHTSDLIKQVIMTCQHHSYLIGCDNVSIVHFCVLMLVFNANLDIVRWHHLEILCIFADKNQLSLLPTGGAFALLARIWGHYQPTASQDTPIHEARETFFFCKLIWWGNRLTHRELLWFRPMCTLLVIDVSPPAESPLGSTLWSGCCLWP